MHLHFTVQKPIYIISFIIHLPVKAFTTLKRFKKDAFYSPRHSTSRNSLPTWPLRCVTRSCANIHFWFSSQAVKDKIQNRYQNLLQVSYIHGVPNGRDYAQTGKYFSVNSPNNFDSGPTGSVNFDLERSGSLQMTEFGKTLWHVEAWNLH